MLGRPLLKNLFTHVGVVDVICIPSSVQKYKKN